MALQILIIEDDRSMARLISHLIEPIKIEFPNSEVNIVHNFEDAKRIIHGIPPVDCALLDLSLPPLRHQDTIARLHEIEGYCAIVIVTGHSITEVRKLLGAREYEIVHKEPGMINYLFTSMHNALSKYYGKEKLDQAYEAAWDRLRALKSYSPPPNGPQA